MKKTLLSFIMGLMFTTIYAQRLTPFEEANGKYGYKDVSEMVIIQATYDYAGSFSEGLAPIQLNEKWGYIDNTGKEIISPLYDRVNGFKEDLCAVQLSDKWGYLDKTGKVVIPLKYDDTDSFSEGLAPIALSGKWGYINKTGKVVIPLKYEYAYTFSEGLGAVQLNEKWGFIDKTGKVVIQLRFYGVGSFSDGLATYYYVGPDAMMGHYGYIDNTGETVIAPLYDGACNFSEGLALVAKGDYHSYIDKTGKALTEFKYQNLYCSSFTDGLGIVVLRGKYGFINDMGEEVISLLYDSVNEFLEGRAEVELDGRTFYIDKTGQEVSR